MTDPFVPEADALEQRQEVTPPPVRDESDDMRRPEPALEYPERVPNEVPEADALEQSQVVESSFEDERNE